VQRGGSNESGNFTVKSQEAIQKALELAFFNAKPSNRAGTFAKSNVDCRRKRSSLPTKKQNVNLDVFSRLT